MISGFQTAHSIYYVDFRNRTIWGGKLGNRPRPFIQYQMMIGGPGYFLFNDGGQMTTGIITRYI